MKLIVYIHEYIYRYITLIVLICNMLNLKIQNNKNLGVSEKTHVIPSIKRCSEDCNGIL